jgi:hypothetical protein
MVGEMPRLSRFWRKAGKKLTFDTIISMRPLRAVAISSGRKAAFRRS